MPCFRKFILFLAVYSVIIIRVYVSIIHQFTEKFDVKMKNIRIFIYIQMYFKIIVLNSFYQTIQSGVLFDNIS